MRSLHSHTPEVDFSCHRAAQIQGQKKGVTGVSFSEFRWAEGVSDGSVSELEEHLGNGVMRIITRMKGMGVGLTWQLEWGPRSRI